MLSQDLVRAIAASAAQNGIEPAALLAVVEIESSGEPHEKHDGLTPRFLFERHKFHAALSERAPQRLARAVAEGLAHADWRPKTQYKDQGSSASRIRLLTQARAIDEECANRACSWGLGQTMGSLAEELGFGNATAMVATLQARGVEGQLALMLQDIRRRKILDALNRHDWDRFALRYNGKRYRELGYDTKLANAYARWRNRPLDAVPTARPTPAVITVPVSGSATRPIGAPPTQVPTSPPLSPIDNMLGGEALAGKKTLIAVLAYVALSIMQATGQVGTATGAPAATVQTTAVTTAPATSAGLPAASPVTSPAGSPATTPSAGGASTLGSGQIVTMPGSKTPAGEILTMLIAAFGGLGFLAKIDRALGLLSMLRKPGT